MASPGDIPGTSRMGAVAQQTTLQVDPDDGQGASLDTRSLGPTTPSSAVKMPVKKTPKMTALETYFKFIRMKGKSVEGNYGLNLKILGGWWLLFGGFMKQLRIPEFRSVNMRVGGPEGGGPEGWRAEVRGGGRRGELEGGGPEGGDQK